MLHEDDITTLINKYPKFIRIIRRKIFQWISCYFSINNEFTKSYLGVYNNEKKIFKSVHGVDTRIYNPVSEEEKLQLRKKLNIPHNSFIIISVGYLIKRKGFDELFIIISKLKIPFLYIIVGDFKVPKWHYMYNFNDEMNYLFNKGKRLLKEKVLFIGPKENVNEYLKSSDIFLMNSKQEGFPPNALQEAMACGIPPVICYIYGSENSIIENKKNSLIYNDIIEVNKLIESCYYDKTYLKRLGNQANRSIIEQASFENIYLKLFSQLY
jgi:glycosyltransferase involved in cell wall biosynthesis